MPARSWHRAGRTAGKPGCPGAGAEMPERFTERARRVAVLAQDESRMPGHEHIGTGHILPCLIREDQGLAAKALESLAISSLEGARQQVEESTGWGERGTVTGRAEPQPAQETVAPKGQRRGTRLDADPGKLRPPARLPCRQRRGRHEGRHKL
jgi:hypothetical protein